MDVCCFNRPFDDQTQDRIHMESEAILTILGHCVRGDWKLIGSEIIDLEILKIPDKYRKERVFHLSKISKAKVEVNKQVWNRYEELKEINLTHFDALHIACAEIGKADIFLTTDDDIIKKFNKSNIELRVDIKNPIKWLMEVENYGD
jgi:predicted nucleic acid-binding protein